MEVEDEDLGSFLIDMSHGHLLQDLSEEWVTEVELQPENQPENDGRDGRDRWISCKFLGKSCRHGAPRVDSTRSEHNGSLWVSPALKTRPPALTTRPPALTTRLPARAARAADNSAVSRPCAQSGHPTLQEAVSLPLPA